MRRLKSTFASDAERGATAIVVALLLTVLLGFAGLAVDLGASYAKHTELQNGADAAAFAIAQDLAPGECGPPPGASATSWVEQNVISDDGATGAAVCDPAKPYQVKVTAEQLLQHWFMPVVGKNDSDIAADATVQWGVPMAGSSIPLAISNCRFSKYFGGDEYIDLQQDIWMEHPNDPEGNNCEGEDGGMPPGGFSWLTTTGGCQAAVKIDASGVGGWVGSDTGVPAPNVCTTADFKALVDQEDLILIPIFDFATGSGSNGKYHIIKFAAFDLNGIYIHAGSSQVKPAYGSGCSPQVSNYKNCLSGKFVEFVSLEDAGLELGPPMGAESTVIFKLID